MTAGIATSDFSLFSITLNLTPKGMAKRDVVIDMVYQWINLIKTSIMTNDKLMSKYHDELFQMSQTFFRYRENGDPTDFCSSAAEMLFDFKPNELLLGSAQCKPYNPEVSKEYLKRFNPENSMITIFCSDDEAETGTSSGNLSAKESEWQQEKWYHAKYRETKISSSLKGKWGSLNEADPRLRLPELNSFIPTDFSLRSEDDDVVTDPNVDYSKENPKLLIDRKGVQLW